jgi:hypothetical protein
MDLVVVSQVCTKITKLTKLLTAACTPPHLSKVLFKNIVLVVAHTCNLVIREVEAGRFQV